jgi:hypothetical protein
MTDKEKIQGTLFTVPLFQRGIEGDSDIYAKSSLTLLSPPSGG